MPARGRRRRPRTPVHHHRARRRARRHAAGDPLLREQGAAASRSAPAPIGSTTYRDRGRLLLILRGKRLGFSLARIQQYLDLYDADPTSTEQLVHLLRGARQRIDELERQRHDLELTLDELREVEAQCVDAMRERGIDADTEPAAERKLAAAKNP